MTSNDIVYNTLTQNQLRDPFAIAGLPVFKKIGNRRGIFTTYYILIRRTRILSCWTVCLERSSCLSQQQYTVSG